jgi:hypothetical protein
MKDKIQKLTVVADALNNEIHGILISFNYKNYILSMMCESIFKTDEDILETKIKYVMAIRNYDFSSFQLNKFNDNIIKTRINPVSTMMYSGDEIINNLILKENMLGKEINAITSQINKVILKDIFIDMTHTLRRKKK